MIWTVVCDLNLNWVMMEDYVKRVLDGASMFYDGLFFVVILLGGVHIDYYYCYYWAAVVLLTVVDAEGMGTAMELEVPRCRRPLLLRGASYDE